MVIGFREKEERKNRVEKGNQIQTQLKMFCFCLFLVQAHDSILETLVKGDQLSELSSHWKFYTVNFKPMQN